MKSIADVLEEVEEHIDTHFNEFAKTVFTVPEKGYGNQNAIEFRLTKKTWKTQLLPQNDDHSRDPGKPPLCREEKRTNYQRESGDDAPLHQNRAAAQCESHHQLLRESDDGDQCTS